MNRNFDMDDEEKEKVFDYKKLAQRLSPKGAINPNELIKCG